jgi:hypothetical protein
MELKIGEEVEGRGIEAIIIPLFISSLFIPCREVRREAAFTIAQFTLIDTVVDSVPFGYMFVVRMAESLCILFKNSNVVECGGWISGVCHW